MSRNATASIIIVLLILLGGFFYFQSHSVVTPVVAPEETSTPIPPTPSPYPSASNTANQNLVTITSTGFSPTNITIKAEDSINWLNQDSKNHQVDSDPPLSGVNLLSPNQQTSFQFSTPGTYHFHDHLNPHFQTTVLVK